jgi:hypothetical protein
MRRDCTLHNNNMLSRFQNMYIKVTVTAAAFEVRAMSVTARSWIVTPCSRVEFKNIRDMLFPSSGLKINLSR